VRVSEWFDVLADMGEQERRVSLAYVAGESVTIDEDELHAALRRAVLLRATGGDPHRELELDEPSVTRFAEELDTPERREQLQLGLASLSAPAEGRSYVTEAIVALLANPELSWRCFAAAQVAAELAAAE
jgi:hypothetical protein